jgi:hypothetical protein
MANSPFIWHVAVNNPTDKEITTTIRTAMAISGLVLLEKQRTIRHGEYVVLTDQRTNSRASGLNVRSAG